MVGGWCHKCLWCPEDIVASGNVHCRTEDSVLSYHDDQSAADFATWHGPEELKEPRLHER